MGASYSKTSQYVQFTCRGDQMDWNEYLSAEWRCSRSAELDKFGGLGRPAVERGRSVTAKLDFLSDSVQEQAQEMQDAMARAKNVPEHLKVMLGQPSPKAGASSGKRQPVFLEAVLDPSTRQKPPAEWRLRTHAARRRIILMLSVIHRLKDGLKHRRRLRRVDSFSYLIQNMLKDDMSRFAILSQQLDKLKREEEAELARHVSMSEASACGSVMSQGSATSSPIRKTITSEWRASPRKDKRLRLVGFGSYTVKEVCQPIIKEPPLPLEKAVRFAESLTGRSRLSLQRRRTTDGGAVGSLPSNNNDSYCKESPTPGIQDLPQTGTRRLSLSGDECCTSGADLAAAGALPTAQHVVASSVRPAGVLVPPRRPLRRCMTFTDGAVGGAGGENVGPMPLFNAVGTTSRFGHTPAIQRSLLPQRLKNIMGQQLRPKRLSESGIMDSPSNGPQNPSSPQYQLGLICTTVDSNGLPQGPLTVNHMAGLRPRVLNRTSLNGEPAPGDASRQGQRTSASGFERTSVPGVPGGGAGSQRTSLTGQPGELGSARRRRTLLLNTGSLNSSGAPSMDGSVCPDSPTDSNISAPRNGETKTESINLEYGFRRQSTSQGLIGGDDPSVGDSVAAACKAPVPQSDIFSGRVGASNGNNIKTGTLRPIMLPRPPAGPSSTESVTSPRTPPPAIPTQFKPSPPGSRPRPPVPTYPHAPSPPLQLPGDVANIQHHSNYNRRSSSNGSPGQQMHHHHHVLPVSPTVAAPAASSLIGQLRSPGERSSAPVGVFRGGPVCDAAGLSPDRQSTSVLSNKTLASPAADDHTAGQVPGAGMNQDGGIHVDHSDDVTSPKHDDALPEETKEERTRRIELIAAQRRLEAAWELELAQREGKAWEDMTQEEARKLMTMYINRANAHWLNSKTWSTPAFWDAAKQQRWAGTEDCAVWKDTVIDNLQQGKYAVQVHCSGQTFECQELGRSYDLYSTCPWDLLNMWKPHATSQASNKICGVPWGVRVLAGMAYALEEVGGIEALEATPVILHLNEDDWEQQLSILNSYNFCGFSTKNIFILTQKSVSGYTYDPDLKKFVQSEDAATTVVGSGYGLMQLNWTSEAKTVDEDGVPQLLHGTVLEELQDRGCKWLVSHPLRDMCLVSAASWLDLLLLPFLAACHEVGGAAGMTQVTKQDNVNTLPRADCSLVLGCAHGLRPKGRPAANHPVHSVSPIRELRACEVMAGSAKGLIRTGAKLDTGHYLLGLDRHVFALDKLAGLLVRPDVVRPKLTVRGKNVFMHLHVSDVTGHDSLKTVAVEARHGPTWLNTPSDLEDLLSLVTAQDNNEHFRILVGNRKETLSYSDLPSPGGLLSTQAAGLDPCAANVVPSPRSKRPIVVFISSNAASSLAVDAAVAVSKPGRDIIHLVTVVSSHLHVAAGQNLLTPHVPSVTRVRTAVTTQVLIQASDTPELISTMDKYVDDVDAQLVVMATKMLHSHTISTSSILGSVTLAALKRLDVPMLIVNPHCAQVGELLRSRCMRAMAVVHRSSKPLVQLLCSEVLQPSRGDSLVICRVEEAAQPKLGIAGPTVLVSSKDDQKMQQSLLLQRAVGGMNQVALLSGFQQPDNVKVEGENSDVLDKMATKHKVNLIGYILPSQVGKVPDHLVKLLHGCKSAVLVCRHTAQVAL